MSASIRVCCKAEDSREGKDIGNRKAGEVPGYSGHFKQRFNFDSELIMVEYQGHAAFIFCSGIYELIKYNLLAHAEIRTRELRIVHSLKQNALVLVNYLF